MASPDLESDVRAPELESTQSQVHPSRVPLDLK
jgi:hypothetical protein